jgi:1,2-phenylacetyl-CoA epoxidase catalytic subunit
MTLYYHKRNYEIKDLDDTLIQGWIDNNNPKIDQWVLMPPRPSENHYWTNGAWVLINPAVPENVSARQIRLWLINNGFQLIQVEQAIDSIQDTITRETVKVEWEYAPYVERNHPMLVPLAQALGLTENQVDQAFIQAQYI